MVGGTLGLSVSAQGVHGVLVRAGRIAWAGAADYATLDDLSEVIARLAGECARPVRRVRVVLERDVVQLRTLLPAPPLKARAVSRYVALEAPRLFRKNGKPLVTDGVLVPLDRQRQALWAGAAEEPLVRAVLQGGVQAGLEIPDVGPAADVLPLVVRATTVTSSLVFPNGGTSEVIDVTRSTAWRSRWMREGGGPAVSFVPALAELGEGAPGFAAAYGAAVGRPRLSLLPADTRAARDKRARRSAMRLGVAAAAVWLGAAGVYVGRLVATLQTSTRSLDALRSSVDSALSVRRDLLTAEATLDQIADAERTRSRHLALLAALTLALGDSITIVALRINTDGTVRLGGYAPIASQALAALERVPGVREPRFEGPVTREARAGRSEPWDRFAIVAQVAMR